MNNLTKFWNFLDGKKLYIGLIIWKLIDLPSINSHLTPDSIEIINYVLSAWTGIAVGHKIQKKSSSKKVTKD